MAQRGRSRPKRRSKALVGALMRVHRGNDAPHRADRAESKIDAPVIAQRRIKRNRARRDLDREPVQPVLGDEIEQRRGRDQIDRPIERGFEIAVEIERDGGRSDCLARGVAAARASRPRSLSTSRQFCRAGRRGLERAQWSSRCRRRDRRPVPRHAARERRRPRRARPDCARADRKARAAPASRRKSRSCQRLQRARKDFRGLPPGRELRAPPRARAARPSPRSVGIADQPAQRLRQCRDIAGRRPAGRRPAAPCPGWRRPWCR